MRDYAAACDFLENRVNYERFHQVSDPEREFKLDRMRKMVKLLGGPQHRFPIIHVAGSKGKGSTAVMIESILRAGGHRTGLFTSPHLQRVEERNALDGKPCRPEEFSTLLQEVRPAVEVLDREAASAAPPESGPTYFEILTAMALVAFARWGVQAAVLEVGLGGRLDSTNVCTPCVSVITSISRDHTQQLGNSLASITREKAGIIKPGVPVISGVVSEESQRVLREIARQNNAPLVERGVDFDFRYRPPQNPQRRPAAGSLDVFSMKSTWGLSRFLRSKNGTVPFRYENLSLPLLGRHQAANAAVAVAVTKQLQSQGWSIPERAIPEGLAGVVLPARIEVAGRNPTVILDSAHNSASIDALLEVLQESFSAGQRRLLLAATRDKDVTEMLARLLAFFDTVVFTQYTTNPRAVPAADLAEQAAALSGRAYPHFSKPAEAWQSLYSQAAPEDLLCITGSFFLAGEMREYLAERNAIG